MEGHSITRAVRCATESGDVFVIMPARDYTLLTGIDPLALPAIELSDTVDQGGEVVDKHDDQKLAGSNLARMRLEEEIAVEDLPL